MVSNRTVGALLVGSAVGFGAILWAVVRGISQQSAQLGCLAQSAGCQEVATAFGASHVAIGFLSAVLSLGVYFLVFARAQTPVVDSYALIRKTLSEGERSLLDVVREENGILQSDLAKKTDLTPGRVSQILARFEEQGLVARELCGRTYKVRFTI